MATDICLNVVCNQRLRQMLFTIPPSRFNPVSPYPQYTQNQLNMRRKAEILNYNAAKSNSKTNNFTKVEKYALLVNGRNQNQSYANIYDLSYSKTLYKQTADGTFNTTTVNGNVIVANVNLNGDITKTNPLNTPEIVTFKTIKMAQTALCNSNLDMVPTPTSSSDVPGPISYLIRDVSVPLYNYATNNNAYSINPSTNNPMWSVIPISNTYCSQTSITNIFSLGISDLIDQSSYNFSFTTPFSLGFYSSIDASGSFSISDVSIKVLFSGSEIQGLNPIISFNYIKNGVNTIYSSNSDISLNFNTNQSITQRYSGFLTVANLNLFTSPGYIYDVAVKFTFTNPIFKGGTPISYSYGAYCNLTQVSTSINPNSLDFSKFAITAT